MAPISTMALSPIWQLLFDLLLTPVVTIAPWGFLGTTLTTTCLPQLVICWGQHEDGVVVLVVAAVEVLRFVITGVASRSVLPVFGLTVMTQLSSRM